MYRIPFSLPPRRPSCGGLRVAAVGVGAWCLAGCVQWRPVTPPPPSTPPRAEAAAAELPRWVRVTTRDSARYLLEDAAFRGDTLVGRASEDRTAAEPLVRVPTTEIAHLEARVPSLTGSAGMAAAVVVGVATLAWTVGHAASR